MSLLDDIRSAPKVHTNTWKPQPGDCLVGELVQIRTVPTVHGSCQFVDIRSELDEQIYSAIGHTVLINELTRQNAKPGDQVAIRYDGPVKNYHRYSVIVRKAVAEEF